QPPQQPPQRPPQQPPQQPPGLPPQQPPPDPNGPVSFQSGPPIPYADITARYLGLRDNGQGQYVNAQGQVVGLTMPGSVIDPTPYPGTNFMRPLRPPVAGN